MQHHYSYVTRKNLSMAQLSKACGRLLAAKDAETGESLAVDAGRVTVPLPGHGFAMVELTADRAPFPHGPETRRGTVVSLARRGS